VQAMSNGLGVFAQHACAFFDDLHHSRAAGGTCIEDDRCKRCDFHLVGCLHPANKFVEVIQ
jgi:hypothetical protein